MQGVHAAWRGLDDDAQWSRFLQAGQGLLHLYKLLVGDDYNLGSATRCEDTYQSFYHRFTEKGNQRLGLCHALVGQSAAFAGSNNREFHYFLFREFLTARSGLHLFIFI